MAIATANNIKNGEKIIDEIKRIVSDWEYFANKVKVSSELTSSITKTLQVFEF